MKNINDIKYSLVIFSMALLALAGCHKVSSNTPMANVGLHMHISIDSTQLDPIASDAYQTDASGRVEDFKMAQFYVSSVSLRNKASQQWYTIPNSLILKRLQNELYPIGSVPATTYDALRFTIGLNNTLNSAAPSSYSTTTGPDTVLSLTEQAVMWLSNTQGTWSRPSGYTFANIQGYDSTDHIAFSYQLGGFGDTTAIVTLPYAAGFTLAANQPAVTQYLHVIADFGKLLQNINIAAHPVGSFYSTTPQNVTNATNVWQNIVNVFSYECTVPNGDC